MIQVMEHLKTVPVRAYVRRRFNRPEHVRAHKRSPPFTQLLLNLW